MRSFSVVAVVCVHFIRAAMPGAAAASDGVLSVLPTGPAQRWSVSTMIVERRPFDATQVSCRHVAIVLTCAPTQPRRNRIACALGAGLTFVCGAMACVFDAWRVCHVAMARPMSCCHGHKWALIATISQQVCVLSAVAVFRLPASVTSPCNTRALYLASHVCCRQRGAHCVYWRALPCLTVV